MTVEDDVSEILANLEGRRPGSWGLQAALVAEGVRGSGIIDRIDASSDRMHTNLAGLAAVMGISAQAIASEIATSNRFLGMVIDSLRDPRATAADERFRTGLTALQKGWRPEAIDELEESVRLYRFHPETHAVLGHALAAEGRLAEAATSYSLAQRYSIPGDPSFAAGCVLLAAAAHENDGHPERAAELILSSIESLPEFAELPLALARITRDPSMVKTALNIAPDLVVVAMAADIPGVEEAADDLAAEDDGPVALATRFIAALERARLEFPDVATSLMMPQVGGRSAVDDLMASAAVFTVASQAITESRRHYERSYKTPERHLVDRSSPLASEIQASETELRAVGEQRQSIKAELDKNTALLVSRPHEFRYATATRVFLEGQTSEVSQLLDELAERERVIRTVDIDEVSDHLDWIRAGKELFSLREKLETLGIKNPAGRRARDEMDYYERIQIRNQELLDLLKAVEVRGASLATRSAELRYDGEAEQKADQAAFQTALDAWTVRNERWNQLISAAELIAAQRPLRRSPWDGVGPQNP